MKKDHTTLRLKASLRKSLLIEVENPIVMETHGGWGSIWRRCYSHLQDGVVFEKNGEKALALARQRPMWAVYEADCEKAIAEGVGFHLPVNFIDLDPYSQPWPIIDSVFQNEDKLPDQLAIAVNDGLRQKLRMGGGWNVGSLVEVVDKYGNAALHDNYLEICQELLTEKAGQLGYELTRWAGYYCGHIDQMTHYAAVFVR